MVMPGHRMPADHAGHHMPYGHAGTQGMQCIPVMAGHGWHAGRPVCHMGAWSRPQQQAGHVAHGFSAGLYSVMYSCMSVYMQTFTHACADAFIKLFQASTHEGPTGVLAL